LKVVEAERDALRSFKPSVLTLIHAHNDGDNERFANYARFIAEKANDPWFTGFVEKALRGDYGATVYPMEQNDE
jgi:hypothetical protein